jgi:hypothetical protein
MLSWLTSCSPRQRTRYALLKCADFSPSTHRTSSSQTLEEIAIIFKDYDSVRPPADAVQTNQQEFDEEKKMADYHNERV